MSFGDISRRDLFLFSYITGPNGALNVVLTAPKIHLKNLNVRRKLCCLNLFWVNCLLCSAHTPSKTYKHMFTIHCNLICQFISYHTYTSYMSVIMFIKSAEGLFINPTICEGWHRHGAWVEITPAVTDNRLLKLSLINRNKVVFIMYYELLYTC